MLTLRVKFIILNIVTQKQVQFNKSQIFNSINQKKSNRKNPKHQG